MEKGPQITKQSNIENPEKRKGGGNETKGKIKIEIGGKEYELETTSYDFEYPENIQKETGILGYKRTIIREDNLSELKEKYKKESDESRDENRKFISEKEYINKLCLNLSNGEYPTRTFTHAMGAYSSSKEYENLRGFFKEDRFFLQKLFDVDLAQKALLSNRLYRPMIAGVFNKKTGELIKKAELPLLLQEYKDEIKENELFVVGYDAFNTNAGKFWQDSLDESSIGFGFSFKDSFLKEYLREIYSIFLKDKNRIINRENIIGMEEVLKMLAFGDEIIFEKTKNYHKNSFQWPRPTEDIQEKPTKEELNNLFKEVRKKFVPEIDEELMILNKEKMMYSSEENYVYLFKEDFLNLINGQNSSDRSLDSYLKYSTQSREAARIVEVLIPIFINHDDIPQLSWGHAKYAHFFNQKGFNFFEFKHTDHLPKSTHIDKSGI